MITFQRLIIIVMFSSYIHAQESMYDDAQHEAFVEKMKDAPESQQLIPDQPDTPRNNAALEPLPSTTQEPQPQEELSAMDAWKQAYQKLQKAEAEERASFTLCHGLVQTHTTLEKELKKISKPKRNETSSQPIDSSEGSKQDILEKMGKTKITLKKAYLDHKNNVAQSKAAREAELALRKKNTTNVLLSHSSNPSFAKLVAKFI